MNKPPTLSSQIFRRLAAALAAAWLLIAVLIAALAFDIPVAAKIITGLLAAAAAAGSFFWLRPALRQLQALDGFERDLTAAGQAQVFRPVEQGEAGPAAALYTAYNRLARRSSEGSAKIFRYLSRMYHEGNTLLASILGYGSMIADTSLRPDDANLEEYGQIVVDQARSSAALLEDFTMAARIEGGLYAPVLRPVRIQPLLTTLVEELAEQSGHEIVLTCAAAAGEPVQADALSLEKALRKIVENAIKFSPPGSPVRIHVETCSAPRQLNICIADQGAGIPAAELDNLFQPFARGKQEVARRVPGYGLGLYIAHEIVRAHLGEISVQSQPGAGAAFTITLPLEGTKE